jgi:hypothetical protein
VASARRRGLTGLLLWRRDPPGGPVAIGIGNWYQAGGGLVPIRWLFVHSLDGTHRNEDFYATDPVLDQGEIVTRYAGRWSIESTFQEGRRPPPIGDHAGPVRADGAPSRPVPARLYTVVAMLYLALLESK